MSSHEIHHLLHLYGLATVFVAVFGQALFLPIPGSTVVIAAAVYAASSHGFPLLGVIASATAGVTLGGLAGFALGRWRGVWALERLGRLLRQPPERVRRLRAALDRHAVLALFAARWFTGTRNLAGIASGASAMSPLRFGVISLCAALLWATLTGCEFYFFGGVLLGAPTWLQVLLVVGGIGLGLLVAGLVRRRVRAGDRRTVPPVGSADERAQRPEIGADPV